MLHTAGPMLFQFPPLREGRLVRISMETYASGISIPAPARGATGAVVADQDLLFHFNSRPCARDDFLTPTKGDYDKIFQFPPLREGRPCQH